MNTWQSQTRWCIWSVIMTALLGSACEDKKKDAPVVAPDAGDRTVSQAQEPASEAETGAAAPVVAPLEVLDVADAKQVVEAWASAQNEGKFEEYEALYASRFTGVKRVGPKRLQYDRQSWLEDRERMFKKKMEVTLEDLEVVPGSGSVVVRVTQTWASGGFKDKGPKQLVLVPEGAEGTLKIAREEMLASQLVDEAAKPERLDVGSMGFAMSSLRQDLFVLPVAAQLDWYRAGQVVGIERAHSAVAPALSQELPDEVKKLQGTKIRVFGSASTSCEMIIKGFSIVGEVVPHFGQIQEWDGELEMSGDGKRASDEEVARGVLEMAEGRGLYVAAQVAPTGKACEGWTWGTMVKSAKAAPFSELVDEDMRQEALEFFKSQPGYEALQKEYEEQEQTRQDWSSTGHKPTVRTATLEGRTFIFVHASIGYGCEEFTAQYGALFEQGSDFVMLSDADGTGLPAELVSVADLNGDDLFEFVGTRALVQPVGPVWRTTQEREVPFFDCPC